jgi:lipoyl(octanoyl) transferase
MIALARDAGISAGVIPGDSRYVGVWVDREAPHAWTEITSDDARFPHRHLAKIGAIGVRLSHWCTMHGFAFNVQPDLAHFGLIVPCGIREYGVTSLEDLGASAPSVEAVAERAAAHFRSVFAREDGDIGERRAPPARLDAHREAEALERLDERRDR